VSANVRLPIDALSGVKTLNAPRYVAAAIEARQSGWDDALLLNADGHVCEATSSNVFWWKGDQLCTPPLSDGPVTGTFRNLLLQLASVKGIPQAQKSLSPGMLFGADEVFLTNAVQGIRPVRFFEEKEYPCTKTRWLFEATEQFLEGFEAPFEVPYDKPF
jgi:branched-chain amino acid aminotransferase